MPKNGKILIIEDDTLLAKMYQTKLAMEGFISEIACDGEEGIKLVKSLKPDLILLDLMLPKVDGFTVLATIKKDSETKKIPVIVFSNLAQSSDIKQAKDLGAVDYIVKANLTPNEIIKKIKENL
jgi:DNA-binding response OmpR family regulator